jgi:hypothetical protein
VAKSSTHAIVLAQLIIDGKNHGMHPFMLQLRSLDDHMPMPGKYSQTEMCGRFVCVLKKKVIAKL